MDGAKLSELITERKTILQQLLATSTQQIDAITLGRMSELMSLLGGKQAPLNRLNEISGLLREAEGEDPKSRLWDSPQTREKCRREQDECEQIHLELLAIEAECESSLLASRESLQQQVDRVDAAKQAATRYAHSDARSTAGGCLDLSSD